MHCAELGIGLPDNFPHSEWSDFLRSSSGYPENSEELGDFVRAMQASAYHFRTASEAVTSMIALWVASGGQLDREGRYLQQRDLAAFVGASITSIESGTYACYVTLTQRQPARHAWSDTRRRKGYFYDTLPDKLDACGMGGALSAELRAMTVTPEWKELQNLRNTFMHRTLPSRLHEGASGPSVPPNEMVKYAKSWGHDEVRATEAQMIARLDWVASRLRSIYGGGSTI